MPTAPRAQRSSGVHFLATPGIAAQLVQSCPVGAHDLVLEFGAGQGAITTHLVETGARIVAIERDPEFARVLCARFAGSENLKIVQADIRDFSLPDRHFAVVASIPYALSTTLFRRLLDPQRTRLRRAALIVEWGFAKRVTAAAPRDPGLAWWAARFDIRLVRRIQAEYFRPRPRVDSALLTLERRHTRSDRALWTLLENAYRTPAVRAGKLAPGNLRAAGIEPGRPAGTVAPQRWAALADQLADDRALHWPPLPRRFR
ncbi:methyltransferase domain-containing protein [Amycolatopsis acidicola]|uniref:Methyltransferase domain-containing protein n=1 Tax=Amycolatopsis acidicola TaxID=2596893 RepID=A0A5N0UTW1_9PSEU|nr:rRNA adenine N(6)-methyltransferase family protein [Amycolatopsis acidicola]KAA9155786.1 methyltransferase domain-containing protein [Amycolatopsis acidicola]